MPQSSTQNINIDPEVTVPVNKLANTPVADEDQFDADEYVKQLIARMGSAGTPGTPTMPITPVKPAGTPAPPPAPVRVAAPPERRATRAEEIGLESAIEIDPRRLRTPRESNVDLERLREAANITSTNDLHTSDCKGLVRRAYLDLLLATVCIALTGLLLSLSRGFYSLAYLASVMLLGVAALATFRFSTATKILWLKTRMITGHVPIAALDSAPVDAAAPSA